MQIRICSWMYPIKHAKLNKVHFNVAAAALSEQLQPRHKRKKPSFFVMIRKAGHQRPADLNPELRH